MIPQDSYPLENDLRRELGSEGVVLEDRSQHATIKERRAMGGSSDREILNIEEAAALLGVSVKTFNKVLHSQNLPARKIGREWKFSRQALIDWVGGGESRNFYRESHDSRGDAQRHDPPVDGGDGRDRRTEGWDIEVD